MAGAVSFSLTFSTDELALKFVREVTHALDVVCLRDGKVVHAVAVDEREMLEVLNVGHHFGGTNPKMRTLPNRGP